MTIATGTMDVMTPERLVLDLRSAGTPAINPDGTRIVYSLSGIEASTGKTHSQLWLIDPDGSNPVQLATPGLTNSGPVWSPDGARIAWVSSDQGDRPNAICTITSDGGNLREVIRPAAVPHTIAWSPDNSTLAYTLAVDPDNPTEEPPDPNDPPKVRATRRLDFKQDNRGYLYDTRLQVMLVDLPTGRVRQLTTALVDHLEPQWSPDGAKIAAKVLNRNGMHQQLGIVDVVSGDVDLVGDADWTVGTWRWSRDGSFILFDGDEENSAQTDYFRYDVEGRSLCRLTEDLPFSPEVGYPTLGTAAQPVWLNDRTALVHGIHAGASGLWTIDAQDGAFTEVACFEALHAGLSVDAGNRFVIQTRSTSGSTGEIHVYDLETSEGRDITQLNDEVFAQSPVGSTRKSAVERDGETIEYWVTYPPGFDATSVYPVVLDVHGGPHGSFGQGFDKSAQILAASGIIVVSSNPRGSGTYGRRFANLVRGDWGGGDWLDVQAALDDVLKEPYANASRTGIIGYSYGGFMTAWAIGHTNRFRAAVCGAPVFDLESFYGTSDIGHVWGRFEWGGELPEHRDWLVEHSPSTHIHHATTPTLIVHGEQDHRCPIGQGEQMFTALSRNGVETEFVRYPGGAHLMLHGGPSAHKIDYYTRIRDWFTDHPD